MTTTSSLDDAAGTLTLRTGVTGRAARMGHRLTIAMRSWRITVDCDGDTPVTARLVVDVDSLQVVSGEGGLTPLSGPEKTLVRANALKTLDAKRFPTVEFDAESIQPRDGGYLLHGPLTVHGVSRPVEVALDVADDGSAHRLRVRTEVRHSDHKVKQYSTAMGAMKVADVVAVEFDATADHS